MFLKDNKKNKKRVVYLDHAAGTPMSEEVHRAMQPFMHPDMNQANPSGLYRSAVEARQAIDKARRDVASAFSAQPDTIIFTSGGTEANNIAILGLARKHTHRVSNYEEKNNKTRKHIITTKAEHHSVLNVVQELEKDGFDVTYLDVDNDGKISLDEFKKALREDTILVSIQYANNEIGSIQPIAHIGREILKYRKKYNTVYPYFHSDACQAAAYLDLDVEKQHVDLMTINGSKIYGPKGVGVLYKRRGVDLEPLMYGGEQESGLRPGTENVAGIVGMGAAITGIRPKVSDIREIEELRDYFWSELEKRISGVELNGPSLRSAAPGKLENQKMRLPNNLNVTFPGVDAEAFIIYMDEEGVQCASGSACSSESSEVSHVLLALGKSEDEARSSIRFSLGKSTTKEDIDYTLEAVEKTLNKLKNLPS